jgi:DNA-binding response OmpR family regulator
MNKLLIVEDESSILMGLEDNFKFEGYEVESSQNGREALDKILSNSYDAIILDVMLPEINGFDICKSIRSKGIVTPVIFLTAKGEEIDKVLGLEIGADDYLTKPFSPRELQARVKALLRRSQTKVNESPILTMNDITIDFERLHASRDHSEIKLTSHEFMILKYLFENKNKVVNRHQIITGAWDSDVVVSNRTVDTHIANLRNKLEKDPKSPQYIKSFRGIGYTLTI